MNKSTPQSVPTAARFYLTHTPEQLAAVCEKAGTTPDYFRQFMYGHRVPSSRLAKALEQHSGLEINAAELILNPPSPGSIKLSSLRRSLAASR